MKSRTRRHLADRPLHLIALTVVCIAWASICSAQSPPKADGIPVLLAPYLERQHALFAVERSRVPPPPPSGGADTSARLGYFEGARTTDPLVAPASSLDVLKKFPPTLIVTGKRAFEQSSAVYTHSLLVKQGVEAELHVWEGMFHGFFYNIDVPESRDCYDVVVKFFDKHLGRVS